MTHKDLKIVSLEEVEIIKGKLQNLLHFTPNLEKIDIERELKIIIEKLDEL